MSEAVAADQLRSIVERIERLDAELDELKGDRKEVLQEAKGNGLDSKVIAKIVALRKKDAQERREEEMLLALYMDALGMLSDTPLGQAAVAREKEFRKKEHSAVDYLTAG